MTPLHLCILNGKELILKRDDCIAGIVSGNKARKFHSLIHSPPHETTYVSHGGNQSNAMLALALLAQSQGKSFRYFTPTLPEWLKKNPIGNLKKALACGMDLRVGEIPHINQGELFIPQGGACEIAYEGCRVLARELREQITDSTLPIVISCGTGTTAYYTALEIQNPVYGIACVGNAAYLYQQWEKLGHIPSSLHAIDRFIAGAFALPQREYYSLYRNVLEQGIELDLLYDIPTLYTLLQHNTLKKMVFVISGGKEGNATMLERYRKKFTTLP